MMHVLQILEFSTQQIIIVRIQFALTRRKSLQHKNMMKNIFLKVRIHVQVSLKGDL